MENQDAAPAGPRDQEPALTRDTDGDSHRVEDSGAEAPVAEADQSESADDAMACEDSGVADEPSTAVEGQSVDESEEGPEDGVDADQDLDVLPSSSEEVSLFVAPAEEASARAAERRPSREMGWKVMAVAGIVLLAAGFSAGVFFPELASRDAETSATTAATAEAAESTTTSTSSPPVVTPSTTVPSEAPSTTAAPTTTTVEVEPVLVEPPDLVVTDEPVSDVANRLVPSVVHLEIKSEDLFEQGAGSGVIFDSRGYILTAAHVVATVVDGSAELTVRLSNGDRLPGQVVGTDPDSDIAVVKVERSGLTPAELSLDERPRAGQLVVAVGSPWGLESSVTSGVISAVDRIVEGKLLVQSDAVLYPGNSGGALADRYGRLIGINVSIFTDSTTLEPIEFQGVGFAVPVDVAHRVARALMEGRPVHTAFLGISGRDTQGDAGVEIMEVFPGSGAERAGLLAGDVVVGVRGRPVTGIADLAARIRHLAPGDVIVLNVIREGETFTLAATLLPRSEVMPDQIEEDPEDAPEEDNPDG